MSIQRRLAISITFVLLVSLVVGFGLTYGHVLSKVRTEMQAALAVGAYSTLNSIEQKDDRGDPVTKMKRIVADFDGDRHLQAILETPTGKTLAESKLLRPDVPAPDWFYQLSVPELPVKVIPLPEPFGSLGKLVLKPDAHNEVAEAWSDARLTLVIMTVFFAMVLALAFFVIKAALTPLREVVAACSRIGRGDYSARIEPDLSRELAPLRDAFNGMAERLEEMGRQNRALNEQISNLQEEERAELARDLHDDVAPFLFSVGADAAMIRRYVDQGTPGEVQARAEAIADSVKHMQHHLKDVLRRLTPGALLDLGLAGAIDNLIAFWKARCPGIAFEAEVIGDPLDPPLDAIAFRIVQESFSNAVRHGRPSKVDVIIDVDDEQASVVVEDDGIGFPGGQPTPGFGLTGMQERVRSIGGTIKIRNGTAGRGAFVEAVLPIRASHPAAEATEERSKVELPA